MADPQTAVDVTDGWRSLTVGRVRGLLGETGPGPVADALAAVESQPAATLEDVLDAVVAAGIRSAPDFALVEGRRVVVRGRGSVVVEAGPGSAQPLTQEALAGGRGPWAEDDLAEQVTHLRLRAVGEASTAEGPRGGPPPADQPPADQPPGGQPPADQPSTAGTPGSPGGAAAWRMPSRLAGERSNEPASTSPVSAEAAPPPDAAPPAEPAETNVQTNAHPDAATDAADPGPAQQDGEVPSYDFLFGATQHPRPAPGDDPDTGAARHAPVEGSGALDGDASLDAASQSEAAAGVTREPSGDATLPPVDDPADRSGPVASPQAPVGGGDSGAPTPVPPPSTTADGVISSVPWARGDASSPAPSTPAPSTPAPPPPATPPPAAVPSSPAAASPPTPAPSTPALPAPTPTPAPTPATPEPSQMPAAPPAPPSPPSPPSPPTVDPPEHTTSRSTVAPHVPPPPDGRRPPRPRRHLPRRPPEPAHLERCRVCEREIPEQQPFEAARPSLGVLRLASGDQVPLDRGVLLGRSPKVKPDLPPARQPHLVRVPSPENDISRNHCEIILEGWHVLVRDLGSTNGTTVQLPGVAPTRLRPEDQMTLEPGSVVTLADQVSVTFEVPR